MLGCVKNKLECSSLASISAWSNIFAKAGACLVAKNLPRYD
jgi:hypothetical protein